MQRLPRHPDRRGDFGELRAAQHRTDRVQPLLNLGQHHQSHREFDPEQAAKTACEAIE